MRCGAVRATIQAEPGHIPKNAVEGMLWGVVERFGIQEHLDCRRAEGGVCEWCCVYFDFFEAFWSGWHRHTAGIAVENCDRKQK
jgi:hypothetical protein